MLLLLFLSLPVSGSVSDPAQLQFTSLCCCCCRCTSWWPSVWNADWCLRSDVMTNPCLQVSTGQSGIRISSELGRGGYVRDVTFENIRFTWKEMAGKSFLFHVNQGYRSDNPNTTTSEFRNFRFKNLIAAGPVPVGDFTCLPQSPCHNITIDGLDLSGMTAGAMTCDEAFGSAKGVTGGTSCIKSETATLPAVPQPTKDTKNTENTGLAAAGSGFRQSVFVIGGGPDPPPTNLSYSSLAAAGVTFVTADSDEVRSVAGAKQMAALCAAHSLACVLPLVAAAAVTAPADGVWGYFVKDEPKAKDFPGLAADVQRVRASHPTALSFINLLGYLNATEDPTGALALYGVPTYDDYVDLFLKTVKPDILSYDYYPQYAANQTAIHLEPRNPCDAALPRGAVCASYARPSPPPRSHPRFRVTSLATSPHPSRPLGGCAVVAHGQVHPDGHVPLQPGPDAQQVARRRHPTLDLHLALVQRPRPRRGFLPLAALHLRGVRFLPPFPVKFGTLLFPPFHFDRVSSGCPSHHPACIVMDPVFWTMILSPCRADRCTFWAVLCLLSFGVQTDHGPDTAPRASCSGRCRRAAAWKHAGRAIAGHPTPASSTSTGRRTSPCTTWHGRSTPAWGCWAPGC